MKRVLLALALVGMVAGGAMAQNPDDLTHGVFILHSPAGLCYTSDTADYCPFFDLTDCCAGQRVDLAADDYCGQILFIVSNFYEVKNFNGVEYGLVWSGDGGFVPVAEGICAPTANFTALPTTDPAWPEAGSGIAMALGEGFWTGTCVPTHWIAAYLYTGYGANTMTLGPNPASGYINWLNGIEVFAPEAIGVLGIDTPGTAVCSQFTVPPEACCFQDGRCEMLVPDDCALAGGVVFAGMLCDPNPCPQPPEPGACCLPDGMCLFILEADCPMAGGTWFGGPCDPNPCPQPPDPEACCFADGTCALLLEAECIAAGGTYFGGACDPNPCPQPPDPEACCFADGTCALLLDADCVAQGGTYYGGACDPNPCPPPVDNDVDSWGEIKSIYK